MKSIHHIGQNKKIVKTILGIITGGLQLSPILLIPACLLLWWYLNSINRMDLFIPSLANLSNLIPIVLSFANYIIGSTLMAYPLLVYLLLPKENERANKRNVLYFVFIVGLLPFIYFSAILTVAKFKLTVILGMQGSVVILSFMFAVVVLLSAGFVGDRRDRHDTLYLKVSVILILFLSVLLIAPSLSGLIEPMNSRKFTSYSMMVGVLCGFVFLSYLPFVYLIYVMRVGAVVNIVFAFAIIPMYLLSPVFALPNVALHVLTKKMEKIGVVDWNSHLYHVNSVKYSSGIFPPDLWKTKEIEDGEKKKVFFIHAVRPFYLGQLSLLCPDDLAGVFDKVATYNWDDSSESRESANETMRNFFQKCFVFESEFIKQSDSTFSLKLDDCSRSVNEP